MTVKKVKGVRRSWRAGADCKSVGLCLSWFESSHSHQKSNRLYAGFIFVASAEGRTTGSSTSKRKQALRSLSANE